MQAKTRERIAILLAAALAAALIGTTVFFVVATRARERNSLQADKEWEALRSQRDERIKKHLRCLSDFEARLAAETSGEQLEKLREELRAFKARAPLNYPNDGLIAECIRGESDRLLNDDESALVHYSHVPSVPTKGLEPSSLRDRAALGRMKVRLNQLQDALLQHGQDPQPLCDQILEDIKKVYVSTKMAKLWIALAKEQIDDVDEGATKEIAAGRSVAEAYYLRGLARQERGMREEALADFTASIEADHGKPRVWFHRGSAYFAKGELDLAISDFGRAIKLKPDFIGAWVNRGVARHSRKDLDGAIDDFTHAIKLDPKSVVAHCDRGIARRDKKDFAAAIEDFNEALKLDPTDAGAYFERALTHLTKDDRAAAIADFKRFLELAPEGPEADEARLRLRELGERD